MAASTDIQRALTAADWEGPALRSRIAVHTGETEERDGNYFGPAVNQVARLRGIGHGGQVLVSATTAALLDGSVELTDLGEHRLKDLAAPLRVFQLHAEGLHDSFPALTSLSATPTNLPILLTSFVGRTDEVTRLADLGP